MRALSALFGALVAVAVAGGCSTLLGLDDLRDRAADGGPDGGLDDAPSELPLFAVDSAPTAKCPGNTKQKAPILSVTCQSALEIECCAEITECYAIVPLRAYDDCNEHTACTSRCRPVTDPNRYSDCRRACDATSTPSVVQAFDAIGACAAGHRTSKAACQ